MASKRQVGFVFAGAITASVALAACAGAGAKAPMQTYAKKVIAYFDAKRDFANTLQAQIGGTTGNATYSLIPITGPAYPVGALVSIDNPLDLESRACVLPEEELPAPEPWAELPNWSSSSNLDLGLGIPAFFKNLFHKAESSVDVGLQFQSESQFQISHISQVFLSRSQLRRALQSPECREALGEVEGDSVIFIRGLMYGQETLRSAKGFSAGLDATIVAGDSGTFKLAYDKTGAFELTESEPSPKFAVIAKVALAPAGSGEDGEDRAVLRPGMGSDKGEALMFSSPSQSELAAMRDKLYARAQ